MKKTIFYFVFLTLFASCRSTYRPNSLTVISLEKKGDVQIGGNISNNEQNVNATFAINNKVAMVLNYQHIGDFLTVKNASLASKGKYIETGIARYNLKINENWSSNLMLTYGYADAILYSNTSYWLRKEHLFYQKIALQNDFSLKLNKNSTLSFSNRLAYLDGKNNFDRSSAYTSTVFDGVLDFFLLTTIGLGLPSDTSDEVRAVGTEYFKGLTYEPAITYSIGNQNLRVISQLGHTWDFNKYHHNSLNLNLGIQYKFNIHKKNQ
jgi:hypothetical protein